ncbi:MAG TPA: CPBP family intramembrane glutamic endopeptidase [Terriglobales bacterium]|nr:CPBP family intramembrane glutamic endopeptidase [Terriglobales bacterium]
MASQSKSFVSALSSSPVPETATARVTDLRNLVEVAVVFGLVLVAVWTPQGHLNSAISLTALCLTFGLSLASNYSAAELGLSKPFAGAGIILGLGAFFVLVIAGMGTLTRDFGPPQALPLHRAWQYAVWALLQEFLLQSFMYVRLESVFGSRRAVWLASGLFAVAHFPSPLLTFLSLLGGMFFCEMFRSYRNIYPLGIVHAALGLTIAATLPDQVLHHMRVGIGYLMYHV